MFKALLWKEWRQLALVRWGGIVLGALLPILFMMGADLARRGAFLAGSMKPAAPRNVMFELVPAALALAVWPLIGLMSAAQAFAGDRAAGTEMFLVERPIPAGRLWRARLVAALLNVAVVGVVTGVIAAAAAALFGTPAGIGWSRFAVPLVLGVALALLAFVGSVIASSLISSPMAAVLLGAVLGALPVALAAQMMVFEFARMGRLPLGSVLSVLLLPAYVAGSWLALCRGEPAGRGRLRRTMTALVTAIAGIVVMFVGLAPIVVRANAMSGMHTVAASPSGASVFLASPESDAAGGWIVDVASGTRLAFVAPPVRELVWAPDGSEVAFLTSSGPLGSSRSEERLDVRSTADGRVLRSIAVGEGETVYALSWADAGIVAVVLRAPGSNGLDVEIIDPVTGRWRSTGFRWQGSPVDLVGPARDRRVFVRAMVGGNPDEGYGPRGFRLYPVDVAAAQVGAALSDAAGRARLLAGWGDRISPSGGLARVISSEGASEEVRIVELRSGADHPSRGIPPWAVWTDGDRLVWHDDLEHETRLFVGTPGGPPRALRAWRDAQVGVEIAPDGRAVFVSVIPAGEAPVTNAERRPDRALFDGAVPVGASPEEWVYLPGDDRLVALKPAFSDRAHDHRHTEWAGPRTLARIAPGVVYFEDLDAPGKRRFVIGGAHDLE